MIAWLFATAQIGTLTWLLWRGWYRRAPLFLVFLALSSWQAAAGVFAVLYSRAWWSSTWMPVERWHVGFAVLASLEIIWRQTAGLEAPERRGLRVGIPLLAGSFGLLLWGLWRSEATTPYTAFLLLREVVWAGCACALACLMMFGLLKSVPGAAHRWLFGAWMLAHAGIAPLLHVIDTQWFTERTVYRVTVILLCVGWTLTAGVARPASVALPHPKPRAARRPDRA